MKPGIPGDLKGNCMDDETKLWAEYGKTFAQIEGARNHLQQLIDSANRIMAQINELAKLKNESKKDE